jgi:hypothetical protein
MTTKTNTIRSIVAGAIAAGALFAALPGASAHADTGRLSSSNNLKQLGLAVHNFDGDGDVDGRDFLAWQRNTSAGPLSSGDLVLWQDQYGVGPSASSDVDGRDFLEWQRGSSPAPASIGNLADWQANYGSGY